MEKSKKKYKEIKFEIYPSGYFRDDMRRTVSSVNHVSEKDGDLGRDNLDR